MGPDKPSDALLSVPPNVCVAEDGFTLVGKGGRSLRHESASSRHSKSTRQRASESSGGLKGAQRIHCAPFHLSGISLDSDERDIVCFCRSKNVVVTGCYLLHSCVWSMQSAKIFVDLTSKSTVLGEDFWPAYLKCREWQTDAPASRRSRLTPPSA